MKYTKQLAVISLVSFAGEFLSATIPLPVPGSVYGMLLAPGISIIDTYPQVKDSILSLVLISFVTALITMVVTGHVTQFLIRHGKKKGKKEEGGKRYE